MTETTEVSETVEFWQEEPDDDFGVRSLDSESGESENDADDGEDDDEDGSESKTEKKTKKRKKEVPYIPPGKVRKVEENATSPDNAPH